MSSSQGTQVVSRDLCDHHDWECSWHQEGIGALVERNQATCCISQRPPRSFQPP